MSIIITEETLSDIFFNYEHPNFARVLAEIEDASELSNEDYRAALMVDAEEFSKMIDGQRSAQWLVDDLMGRI